MDMVRQAVAKNASWTCQLIHPGDLDAEEAIRWASLLNAKGHNEFAKGAIEPSGVKGGLRRLSVAARFSKEPEPSAATAGHPPGARRESIAGRRESISGRRQSVSGRRGSLSNGASSGLNGIQEDAAGYSGQNLAGVGVDNNGGVRCKYKVLTKCTVREGKDGDSTKLGEYAKGTVIDAIDESTNEAGLVVVRSITALPNGALGGWVKVTTAKGKTQIAKQLGVRSDRRMSITQKNSAGQVIAPAEELIDVTFEGSGALGVMFQEVSLTTGATARPDIIVKTLVAGSIASEMKDLSPGMILRAINGVDIGQNRYQSLMQMIGHQWRTHHKVMITFASITDLSGSEDEHEVGSPIRGDRWVDGAKFGSSGTPDASTNAASASAGTVRNSGYESPRYMGATVWGENVVEEPLCTLMYLGFPELEAKQALADHNDVDMAIVALAPVTPAQV
jgi:hypothetical protein